MTEKSETPEAEALKQRMAKLRQPVPMRFYHEQALCVSIDMLSAALVRCRAALREAQAAHGQVSVREGIQSPGVTAWGESVTALTAAFEEVERDGLDTVMAVRVLLNV